MKRGLTGHFVNCSTAGEACQAFVPDPLPPNPPLLIDASIQQFIDEAHLALGRLDSISTFLPDPDLFLYMYVRKEALLSSQIEGTQSSLADLLLFESEALPGIPLDDVQEVSNYVAAVTYGLQRISEGFPLSLRLLKEIHQVLLSKGRGSESDPGEFRRSQNWVGGTRAGNAIYVPPPPDQIMKGLDAFEKFLHDQPSKTPALIKAALAHVQFETIHPFYDGNGRLGRLLITLILCSEGILSQPLLYLSLYFKTWRQAYYDQLQAVRLEGDWEAWLVFFVEGVRETAQQAVDTAKELRDLFELDREKIKSLGRGANSALRVHQELQRRPIISIPKIAQATGLPYPTAQAALKRLAGLQILNETSSKRNRLFFYDQYLRILIEGPDKIVTAAEPAAISGAAARQALKEAIQRRMKNPHSR